MFFVLFLTTFSTAKAVCHERVRFFQKAGRWKRPMWEHLPGAINEIRKKKWKAEGKARRAKHNNTDSSLVHRKGKRKKERERGRRRGVEVREQ